ncbi:unnamed protein product [Schistocephalus solidus]|uniref:C2H2-type domain-containing protein n=1 Tax=Schistocephalus solidus TaxID=70667 RepID=A0A183SQD5_SCHSO|nr:unnamed protein product [Schistocephalus solidus]
MDEVMSGHQVDLELLQRFFQSVLGASFLTSLSAGTRSDVSVEKSFGKSLVVHSYQLAAPSQLHLPQHGVDAEDSGPLQDFHVRDSVLLSQLNLTNILPYVITVSAPVTHITTTKTALAFTTTISDVDSLLNCPQCDRTFISRIGLVGHFQIHRTETGEPVPGAPTHSRDRHLHCPYCPRAFTHHMGLFSHIRIHDSGIHHNANNIDTPCTPFAPAILITTATTTTMNHIAPESSNFSCPQCTRNFNSRIGLVGHLRIHRTEAGKTVPGVPTYSLHARLHCFH